MILAQIAAQLCSRNQTAASASQNDDFLTLRLQRRINERLFRRIVLLVLAFTGVVLLSRIGT